MTDKNQERIERILGKPPERHKEELIEHRKMSLARYQLDSLRIEMASAAGELKDESPDDYTVYL